MVCEVEPHGGFPCLPCLTSDDDTDASRHANDSRVQRRLIYDPGWVHLPGRITRNSKSYCTYCR